MNEDVWYFAYGSNLWIDQKEKRTGAIRSGERPSTHRATCQFPARFQ